MSAWPRVDFFVIGAQKCATSWLYQCLREHPEILLPAKKDEANYIGGPRYRERGADWYESLYPVAAGARGRGSVSVDYLFDTAALDGLLQHYPRARFIACLRNPLDRARSAFQFLGRRGLLPAADVDAGLAAAVAAWTQPENGMNGQQRELIERGLYARQLQPFSRHQAWDRLLLLGYERLCEEPLQALEAIYKFVGVTGGVIPPSFGQRPKVNANLPWLSAAERMAPKSRVIAKLADHANRWAVRLGFARAQAPYAATLEVALREVYAADVKALQAQAAQLPAGQALFRSGPASDWGFAP